jgi:hypothetical protein
VTVPSDRKEAERSVNPHDLIQELRHNAAQADQFLAPILDDAADSLAGLLAVVERYESQQAERKIAAYDAARATVKIEGNSRAYYVLRAEAAEAVVERYENALRRIVVNLDGENEDGNIFPAAALHQARAALAGTEEPRLARCTRPSSQWCLDSECPVHGKAALAGTEESA